MNGLEKKVISLQISKLLKITPANLNEEETLKRYSYLPISEMRMVYSSGIFEIIYWVFETDAKSPLECIVLKRVFTKSKSFITDSVIINHKTVIKIEKDVPAYIPVESHLERTLPFDIHAERIYLENNPNILDLNKLI